ncbi:hypothetical protein [Bosea sp. (in: a-proteobacteria)]|uniref:hypothetical protein n=1 Tax=Bosea sp. (in: a-proteobacteria) TaxID=1871050 RepID=UPI002733B048|nr:hypothetical protein [Bosea sp. (in: a-proteobacteria)]MDP3255375.1 hypothetical protein [Bosea sp. (in: a-proteobacteria)]
MKLQIKAHPTGELHAATISPADYDALLALGYPDAAQWHVSVMTGRVNILCPFTDERFPVVLLLKQLGQSEVVEMVDGNSLNLRRDNLRVAAGKTTSTVRKAQRSMRRAFAALEQRQNAALPMAA